MDKRPHCGIRDSMLGEHFQAHQKDSIRDDYR